MPFGRAAALVVLLVCFSASGAHAQGVVVDPGGPSSKEYSLPTDSATQQTAPPGSTGGGGGSSGPDTRFGAGITPSSTARPAPTATPHAPSGSSGSRPASTPKPAHKKSAPALDETDAAAKLALQRTESSGGGGGDNVLVPILVVAIVLILGALIGLALRRSGSGRPART
jgi:hypothetical protein